MKLELTPPKEVIISQGLSLCFYRYDADSFGQKKGKTTNGD